MTANPGPHHDHSDILKKRPGIVLPDIDDFHRVHAVLQERVEQWNRQILEKGRQEGRLEGEARVLGRLLTRRFGALPDWAEQRLAAADELELAAWTDAVLDAGTLDEVFAALSANHRSRWGCPRIQSPSTRFNTKTASRRLNCRSSE